MLTIKQTQNILKDFFNNHMQVNAMYTLDVKGFIAKREKEYLCANIEYVDSNINGKVLSYGFQITLSDLLIPTKDNELDIYNDCSLIAEDLFTFLQYHDDFNYNRSSSIVKFTESDGDRVAGITFKINLAVIRSQNQCSIPLKPNDYFSYKMPVILNKSIQ